MTSLQVDVACIQETNLLPKGKTIETHKQWAVCRAHTIQGKATGGSHIIYVRATLAFSAIYPTAGACNVLKQLDVAMLLL